MKRFAPIAGWLLVAGLAGGADDDYVRVVLETPEATPYSVIRYEVVRRGRATMAVHRRKLPGHGESLHEMGLLTPGEAEAVWKLAGASEATSLPDARDSGDDRGLTWRVELSLDGATHAFRVRDPVNQPDRRYARIVRGVQRIVRETAGEVPFRNVFFPAGRMGWIHIVSIPAARVYVDGFDTEQTTPLYSYEIEAGRHTIRLRSEAGDHDRRYDVKVEASGTTHLHVDLR